MNQCLSILLFIPIPRCNLVPGVSLYRDKVPAGILPSVFFYFSVLRCTSLTDWWPQNVVLTKLQALRQCRILRRPTRSVLLFYQDCFSNEKVYHSGTNENNPQNFRNVPKMTLTAHFCYRTILV